MVEHPHVSVIHAVTCPNFIIRKPIIIIIIIRKCSLTELTVFFVLKSVDSKMYNTVNNHLCICNCCENATVTTLSNVLSLV